MESNLEIDKEELKKQFLECLKSLKSGNFIALFILNSIIENVLVEMDKDFWRTVAKYLNLKNYDIVEQLIMAL